MARIRSIKPSFASDSKVKRLSRDARLTFLLLLPEADDEGRLLGSPKWVAGVLYPEDADVTQRKAQRWLDELEREGMVLPYEHDGTTYLWIVKFKHHQRPQHPTPSTLPAHPEQFTKSSGGTQESFEPVVVGGEGEGEGEGVGSAGFERFWRAYPRHQAKADALKAWPKARKAAGSCEIIVAGATAYASDPNRDDAYTALPATWLRAERWNDDAMPARAAGRDTPANRSEKALLGWLGTQEVRS